VDQDTGAAGRRGLTRVVAGVRGLGIRDAKPDGGSLKCKFLSYTTISFE